MIEMPAFGLTRFPMADVRQLHQRILLQLVGQQGKISTERTDKP